MLGLPWGNFNKEGAGFFQDFCKAAAQKYNKVAKYNLKDDLNDKVINFPFTLYYRL